MITIQSTAEFGADNINDTDTTTTLVVGDRTLKEVSSLSCSGPCSGLAVLGFNLAI